MHPQQIGTVGPRLAVQGARWGSARESTQAQEIAAIDAKPGPFHK
jgi:hypothetical protein